MTTLLKMYPSVLVVASALLVLRGPLVEGQIQGQAPIRKALVDGAIYTFQNVADRGMLTSITTTQDVVTDDGRRQLPSQKWRAIKALVHTQYMLKPLSEDGSKIALGVSHKMRDFANLPVVRKEPYLIGYSSELYWSVVSSLNNYYMLMNEGSKMCLETRGAGKPVGISPCNYSANQQWAIQTVPMGGNGMGYNNVNNGQFPGK